MFKLREHNTSVKTEVLAGITTFAAMMYVLVVNPAILSQTGMPKDAVLAATIWASAIMTLVMGLWTNLPLALAPGMGLNAFFTYTVCLSMQIPWQATLGFVFYSGVLFFILTMTGMRRKILDAIPKEIRLALTAGIGLFITLIGLKNAGLVAPHPATILSLGSLHEPAHLLIWGGIFLAAYLTYKRISASLLITMLVIAIAGLFITGSDGKHLTEWSGVVVSAPPSLSSTFFQLDFKYFWSHLGQALPIVLSLFFVELFDNMGTLIGVCTRAGLANEKGEIKNLEKALQADAFAAMLGANLGTSSVTTYVESAAGVEQGGRTGLTSLVVSGLFLVSLFFAPFFMMIPIAATTPALFLVGVFMLSEIKEVSWKDLTVAVPTFVTLIMIPFSFSIAEGFGLGLITHSILKLCSGHRKDVSWITLVLSVLFAVFFIWF